MLRALIDFLFPPLCHCCGNLLTRQEKFICTDCIARLPRTLYHRRSPNNMELRFAGLFPFQKATAFCFYSRDSHLAQLIQDFKYRGMGEVATRLGEVLGNELFLTGWFDSIDVIVPVPMHWIKEAKRGYNQANLLASGISKATNIPLSNLLKAHRPHRTQTAMNLEQRRSNTNGIFKVKSPHLLEGKHILIVDDVCTTGSTITNAAETLLNSCADIQISILSLCATF